ncbi:MAG: hypothetical protein K0S74_233 [Chlamydiales bacterium]|jgi:hypothetical protein|nr:hypothetical protein [Chlamydiales bacterium]
MKHQSTQKTVRLTIDFPLEHHTYLKTEAAKKGISLRQYVIDHLVPIKEPAEKVEVEQGLSKERFRELLTEVVNEDDNLLRRLAKR